MKRLKRIIVLLLSALFVSSALLATGCIPDSDDSSSGGIEWKQPLSGNGGEYDRYECVEGYYQFTMTANTEIYLSFSVSRSGKYALYTVDDATDIEMTQYAASAQNLGVATPATLNQDGALYSPTECSDKYFSAYWRATYGIETSVDKTVRVRFVREGDAEREPQIVSSKITAKELKGKAPNETLEPLATPWATDEYVSYFYDADYSMKVTPLSGEEESATVKGFYRLGTEDDPGEVIWAAITSIPDRLFDVTFASVYYSSANSLSLSNGKAENGDYLINNYVDFIMNNGGEYTISTESRDPIPAEGDETFLCYQNAVNSDGLYPVNKELYEFLKLYTAQNAVNTEDDVADENKWLAPCYYYPSVETGAERSPYTLSGETTAISIVEGNGYGFVYYAIKPTLTSMEYTIVSTNSLLVMVVEDENGRTVYGMDGNGFNVTITSGETKIKIEFTALEGAVADFPITVTVTEKQTGNE